MVSKTSAIGKVSAAVIPRKDMLPGAEYVGIGDGFNTARWDGNTSRFLALRWDGHWKPMALPYGDQGFFPIALVPVIESPATLIDSASQKKRETT